MIIAAAAAMIMAAKKPLFYGGGGLINSGPRACALFGELLKMTGFPVTLTLMGLGSFPASDKQYLGLVGMHGTFESNNAMHDCDLMINVGARFDDRVTGRVSAFAPGAKKIHFDIDPSSVNKNVRVDLAVIGDAAEALAALIAALKAKGFKADPEKIAPWWKEIAAWRARNSLAYRNSDKIIKPQYAIERLYALTRDKA